MVRYSVIVLEFGLVLLPCRLNVFPSDVGCNRRGWALSSDMIVYVFGPK